MREMQFTGMFMMAFLTLTLVYIVLRRKDRDSTLSQSGWMMALGTTLLAVQFAVQYKTGYRPMGEMTKSAMINLLLFIPAEFIMNMGMLNLQRQGRMRHADWWVGMAAWLVSSAILLGANPTGGMPLMAETDRLRTAEHIVTIIFGAMQLYYTYLLTREDILMKRALANYYDRDMNTKLRWIELSILILALIGVAAPPFIFNNGRILQSFMLILFFGIYYMILSFVCYSVSSDAQTVTVAEEAAWEAESSIQTPDLGLQTDSPHPSGHAPQAKGSALLTPSAYQRAADAASAWLAKGGHLQHDLNAQTVAGELGIPRPQLTAWLKEAGYESFSHWLATMRIDEAKRQLLAHPEWSNESIAFNCGFSDRSYFQKVFHKYTSQTPAQYVRSQQEKTS